MNIEFVNILDVDKDLVELVRTWRNNENVSKYMRTNHYISKYEHKKWINKLKTQDTAKSWIIKYDGKPIGLSSLLDIDYENKTTDWGFYIADESMRGKGIGSITLSKLMSIAFDEMKLTKMYTKVLENNQTALKLYKKHGFEIEKRLDETLERDRKQINIVIVSVNEEKWKTLKK